MQNPEHGEVRASANRQGEHYGQSEAGRFVKLANGLA
jgi:hypothetical protein